MPKKDTKLSVVKDKGIKTYEYTKPEQMTGMARVLKDHIVGHKLYTKIQGKNYAHVEGWQFAGGLLNLFPRVVSVEKLLAQGAEKIWKADVEIVDKNDKIIGRGFALCSSNEANKKKFDEYAILSMAQTRAIGKAYRNSLGWVMKLAGYEGTPKEEMIKVGEVVKEPIIKEVTLDEQVACQGNCGAVCSPQEVTYSKKVYGRIYCRDCQKGKKKK